MVELVLGTAQLGQNYGVTNSLGRPNDLDAKLMLELAERSGLPAIDTAGAYGDAEFRLGELGYSNKFEIISKFNCVHGHSYDIYPHLQRLNLSSITGMLFHNASQIPSKTGRLNLEELRSFKNQGLVTKIGFSAYQIGEIEAALDYFSDPDIIQIPGNALDFRILDSSILKQLASQGVEIHVRSVFLQGLLLAHPFSISGGQHSFLTDTLERINDQAELSNQSVMQFLFNQIRTHPFVSSIVIGASSATELSQILKSWDLPTLDSSRLSHDLDYEDLDPRKWVKHDTK